MKRAIGVWQLIVIVLASTMIPVNAQSNQPAPPKQSLNQWRTYSNVRYRYSVRYPSSLVPQGEADNGDGQKFLSRNAKTQLLVYGSNNVLDETIASRFAQNRRAGASKTSDTVVTFARLKDNWYVVSGYKAETIFYQKCYLVKDHFVTFEISYPKTERAIWDKITSRISRDFQPELQR